MSSLQNLIKVKVEALFHDPPHKSYLISILGESFGKQHIEEAKTFRNTVLANTRFAEIDESVKYYVGICDRLASTIERRVIRASYLGKWPRGLYLKYNYIHNIFDPSKKINISSQSATSKDDFYSAVYKAASCLNKILRVLEPEVNDTIFYNVLYTLLEPVWYVHNLPPSLADTRVPTHTIFDHLYASASIANIVTSSEGFKLRGYYVLADFPGIQGFVGAGRKAGDFWAASYLLSNLMWGLGEAFTKEYGLDVLISPTPRLNPYTVKSLKKWLRNESIVENIKETLANVLKLSKIALEFISSQPIIPATISLLLPSHDFTSSKDVVDSVVKAYRESWRELVDHIDRELESSLIYEKWSVDLYRYITATLSKLQEVLKVPPQGIRIYVIDIEKLYEALYECLVEGVHDKCELVELNINQQELASVADSIRKEVVTVLLWHFITTKAVALAKIFGTVKHPTPRAFFIYSQDKLTPVSSYITSSTKPNDWVHCSLCGIEPAVIRASKSPENPEDYSEDFKREIAFTLGKNINEINWRDFKIHIKPGEAIGPYCLFKRIVYLANINKLPFISTDNIALEEFSHIIKHLDEKYKIFKDLSSVSELKELNTLEGLLEPSLGVLGEVKLKLKDIGVAAEANELSYEEFINVAERALRKVCEDFTQRGDFIRDLLAELKLSVVSDVEGAENIVQLLLSNPHVLRRDRLCRAFRFKTSYAIIRADADNIGKAYRGAIGPDLDSYLKELVKANEDSSKELPDDIKIRVLEVTKDSFDTLRRVLKAINFRHILVTPAWTSVLSLALVISTIKDAITVHEGRGMLIFSGGDDVLAIVPPETAIKTAINLRSGFSDEPFTQLNSNLFIPTIPTGRSISIRYVDLKDLMNYEFTKALDLLEEQPKKALWREQGRETHSKDGLVVSDSRSGINVILPLHKEYREITEAVLALSYLIAVGAISTGIPEDFTRISENPRLVPSRGLEALAHYVLSRSIEIHKKEKELAARLLESIKNVVKRASKITVSIEGEEYDLVTQLLSSLAITRRHL